MPDICCRPIHLQLDSVLVWQSASANRRIFDIYVTNSNFAFELLIHILMFMQYHCTCIFYSLTVIKIIHSKVFTYNYVNFVTYRKPYMGPVQLF